ncbi:MAG TPA: type II toxin-antitoxin system Phd/YefM family antitoxin [Bacillales bacterium]|nr:type II toxin-antitoxin system Phd/YefM family antitoxin [Bacillales bacterium]
MIVSSNEVQKDFQKYLSLAAKEDVIITRNGIEVARLLSMEGKPDPIFQESTVRETAESYYFKGRKASYEEFLELTRDEESRYEYIDGEIFLLASPRTGHQYAMTQLIGRFFNEFNGGTCTPFVAPYDIRLKRPYSDDPCIVQPDLMVICDLDDHLDERDYYSGVPALVVEILSESTQNKDLVKKLDLYLECGVKEYWIVAPADKKVILYELQDQKISQTAIYKLGETAQSFLFEGLSVELKQIFKE